MKTFNDLEKFIKTEVNELIASGEDKDAARKMVFGFVHMAAQFMPDEANKIANLQRLCNKRIRQEVQFSI